MGNLCPEMTVFSRVTAAFFWKYRLVPETGPVENRGSGDTPGEVPHHPGLGRHRARIPEYRVQPAARAGKELPGFKRTSGIREARNTV